MPLTNCVRFFGPSREQPEPISPIARQEVCHAFSSVLGPGTSLYPESIIAAPGGLLAAGRSPEGHVVIALGKPAEALASPAQQVAGLAWCVAPAHADILANLRAMVPWLRPVNGGLRTSFGFGDRLGLAGFGHIAALRRTDPQRQIFPILAQQSIRELTRTQRSGIDVIDAATFACLATGWHHGYGADADHLKTPADVDAMMAAGFCFFTIDPSDYVDPEADTCSEELATARRQEIEQLPFFAGRRLHNEYALRDFPIPRADGSTLHVSFSEVQLDRAVAKYGRAVAHAAQLAHHIARRADDRQAPFEIEVSVDETAHPTTLAEHYFVASELRRAGVRNLVSLAPRFVGEFEKGVDYRGDLHAFEQSLADHAAIAEALGPYKISVHSGSDKFAIYPTLARLTHGRLHVKTAGTSYLEALRCIARCETALFRSIIRHSRRRFETDRATYHISAVLNTVTPPEDLSDTELERVYLDLDAGRQILHVTFGSILTAKRAGGPPMFLREIQNTLTQHEALHADILAQHLGKHLSGILQQTPPVTASAHG